MIKSFIIMSILTGIAVGAFADNNNMPVLHPDKCSGKNSTLVIPKGLEGTSYYFNRDCTIAYIVPPPTASIKISKPALSSNMAMCPAVMKSLKNVDMIYSQIGELTAKQSELEIDDPKVILYNKQITELRLLAEGMSQDFIGVPGLTMQVRLEGSLTQDYMDSITQANMPLIELGLIKIRKAPLSKSYLTFNSVIPGKSNTYSGNPVLESNVMGILSNADESSQDRTSVRFNGGASGYVVLNLIGACNLVNGDFNNISNLKFDAKSASQYLSVTNTMMVPVLNSFGYQAKFNVEGVTRTMFEKYGTKSQFSSNEVTQLIVDGELNNSIVITGWTNEELGGVHQTQFNDDMSIENRQKIKDELMNQYISKLVEFNILKHITPLDTPEAGNGTVTGTRRECRSESSWFGFKRSNSCRDVSYQFLVPMNGTLSQQATIINNLQAQFSETVEYLHPTSRVFTSSFQFKEEGDL